jgi:hypothetical protein
MFVEFPADENTFGIGDQFMLGSAILIKPVVEKSQKSVEVYLPNIRVKILFLTRSGMTILVSSYCLSPILVSLPWTQILM